MLSLLWLSVVGHGGPLKERAATSVGMDVDMSCPRHALSPSWPLIVGPSGPSRERAAIGTEEIECSIDMCCPATHRIVAIVAYSSLGITVWDP
jgi:hypothetical protein